MRNDKAERNSTGRIKPGKTAPYVKKGMVNRLVLWYTDYKSLSTEIAEVQHESIGLRNVRQQRYS